MHMGRRSHFRREIGDFGFRMRMLRRFHTRRKVRNFRCRMGMCARCHGRREVRDLRLGVMMGGGSHCRREVRDLGFFVCMPVERLLRYEPVDQASDLDLKGAAVLQVEDELAVFLPTADDHALKGKVNGTARKHVTP